MGATYSPLAGFSWQQHVSGGLHPDRHPDLGPFPSRQPDDLNVLVGFLHLLHPLQLYRDQDLGCKARRSQSVPHYSISMHDFRGVDQDLGGLLLLFWPVPLRHPWPDCDSLRTALLLQHNRLAFQPMVRRKGGKLATIYQIASHCDHNLEQRYSLGQFGC